MKRATLTCVLLILAFARLGLGEGGEVTVEVRFTSLAGDATSGAYTVVGAIGGLTDGEFLRKDSVPDIVGNRLDMTGSATGAGPLSDSEFGFAFEHNRPNPFAANTLIRFSVPGLCGESSRVTVKVLDVSGRVVVELLNQELSSGHHDVVWQAVGSDGRRVPSGVYFVRVKCGERYATRRVVLLK